MSFLVQSIILLFSMTAVVVINVDGGLYPYGLAAGDHRAPVKDDDCSEIYNQNITMFGKNFSKIHVCTNGVLSLDKEYKKFKPESFPLQTANTALICPFWADVDLCRGGNLWSRETTDPTLLHQASLEVRDGFRTGTDASYNATWMMIATWDDVRAFSRNPRVIQCPLNPPVPSPGNTFQAVMVSNGLEAFVTFNYKKIEWIKGSMPGSTPAQVGFDSGDGVHYHAAPNSQTPGIASIASDSNVGISGKMSFKIGTNATRIVLPDKTTIPTTTITTTQSMTSTQQSSTTAISSSTTIATTPSTIPTTSTTIPTTSSTIPTSTISTTPSTIPTTPSTIPTTPSTIPTTPSRLPTTKQSTTTQLANPAASTTTSRASTATSVKESTATLSLGAIIGISVGAFCIVFAAIIGTTLIFRHKKKILHNDV